MESLLVSRKAYSLHEALYQHQHQQQPCLSWAARYKIALDVANLHSHLILTYVHAHGEIKPSNILLDPQFSAGTKDVSGWCRAADVYSFGKLLHAIISAKENATILPSWRSRRRLGKGENIVFKAVVWVRRHAIPPLPWACTLCRDYILNVVEVDGRVKNEIMASPRAIMQLAAAIRLLVQCTEDDPQSRPSMESAYNTLAVANTCEIPWALRAAVSIGFGLYRSLATLLYSVLFLYVGVYKSVGLFLYYVPYAFNSPPPYDPFDALILLFSLLAFMSLLLNTVCTLNRLDDVFYFNTYIS